MNQKIATYMFLWCVWGVSILSTSTIELIPLHLIYSSILVKIAVADAMTMRISNQLIQLLIPICIISIILNPSMSIWQRIMGFFCISVPMYGVTKICRRFGGAFGGGDIKFIGLHGFLMGPYYIAQATYLALVIASIVILGSGVMWNRKKGEVQRIALGPYLCLGCYVVEILYIY